MQLTTVFTDSSLAPVAHAHQSRRTVLHTCSAQTATQLAPYRLLVQHMRCITAPPNARKTSRCTALPPRAAMQKKKRKELSKRGKAETQSIKSKSGGALIASGTPFLFELDVLLRVCLLVGGTNGRNRNKIKQKTHPGISGGSRRRLTLRASRRRDGDLPGTPLRMRQTPVCARRRRLT